MSRRIEILALSSLAAAFSSAWAKPMEPTSKTLYVFVHGTLDSSTGFIASGCDENNLPDGANVSAFGTIDGGTKDHPAHLMNFVYREALSEQYRWNLYNQRPMINPS